ncbi:hypothetical protein [Chlamydia gallinacea]|uniref:hypothetical protein n=1 Tax=Chlamydia gallinacea TaxID=1457153 RepID=UPI0024E259FC|nr:hypothetical protein [Chlamydia gallinacea]
MSTNPAPELLSTNSNSSTYLSLTEKEMLFIQRRSTYRLFLDTLVMILGFSTLISICTAIFFLNGLNMLTTPTIALTIVLVILGTLFMSIGTMFLINNIDQGISGILRNRLTEANKKIQELTDKLDSISSIQVQESLPISGNQENSSH